MGIQRVYGICFFIAESQVVVGVLLLFAAAVIRSASGRALSDARPEKRRPLWWWLTIIGLWLVIAAFIEIVVLFLSFYPARHARTEAFPAVAPSPDPPLPKPGHLRTAP